MAGYGWTVYDPRQGGVHIVNDTGNKLDMIVEFAKIPDGDGNISWGLDIEAVPRADASDHQKTTVIFYLGSEDPTGYSHTKIECIREQKLFSSQKPIICNGTGARLGNYKVHISDDEVSGGTLQGTFVKSLTVPADTVWQAKQIFLDQRVMDKENMIPDSPNEGLVAPILWKPNIADSLGKGNLHLVQKSFEGRYKFNVLFSSSSTSIPITSSGVKKGVEDASSTFEKRLMSVYPPRAPFNDEKHVDFSKYLLSNLLGGIGYFHGNSKVETSSTPEDAETTDVVMKGPYVLFSSIPSRPFFPRGFFWDEGFHLQVILDWDMDLALEILTSWLDLMDENGWIAREQILGPEARSKVPPEFQTQYPHYANPPTLFLVVQDFVARLSGAVPYAGSPSRFLTDYEAGKVFLKTTFPKLKKYYEWFRRTQAGSLENYQVQTSNFTEGYRWRGRTPQHVLTSGLDDYPRAQTPHSEELHIDALCWVGLMAMTLRNISAFVGDRADEETFSKHHSDVLESVDGIHWSDPDQAYCDTTLVEANRVERICHKGYISLFPFLVGLLGPDHSHLGAVLDLIQDPEELWSNFGIRSLSRKDKYYGTEENYWRSPVWININYLVLQRLSDVGQHPGQHQSRARKMYTELRLNLVDTVFNSWNETGFAWEQYNPDTGKGQRTQHFTGWTSLVVRILAMPDLESGSQPQKPQNRNVSTDKHSWDTRLALVVMGMLLICLVFRRRLMRVWRRLMDTQ